MSIKNNVKKDSGKVMSQFVYCKSVRISARRLSLSLSLSLAPITSV